MSSIKFIDASDILSNLNSLESKIKDKLADVIEDSAKDIRDDAKANAPILTGALKNSIEAVVDRDNLSFIVGSDLEYAAIQEDKKHFLENAVNNNQSNMMNNFNNILDKVVM